MGYNISLATSVKRLMSERYRIVLVMNFTVLAQRGDVAWTHPIMEFNNIQCGEKNAKPAGSTLAVSPPMRVPLLARVKKNPVEINGLGTTPG